jgi:cellulose biosynthesis protein BcsQ
VMMETLTREIADQCGVRILRNEIPAEARFLEAEAFGQPVGEYDAAARSAVAFRSLADEVQSMVAALGAVA